MLTGLHKIQASARNERGRMQYANRNERGVANATCQRKMHKKYPHKLTVHTSDSECIYDRFMYALILCLKLIDACSIEKTAHREIRNIS